MKTNHEKVNNLCKLFIVVVAITALALPGVALAQEDGTHNLVTKQDAKSFEEKSYSPYVGRNFPTKPLFGDTHLHTAISLDAFGYGNKLGAEDAYRFARGETVRSANLCDWHNVSLQSAWGTES